MLAGLAGAAIEDVLAIRDPIFSPGLNVPYGQSQTWEFRNAADNGVARVLVNAEGRTVGAVPDGYAEYALRAQDEIRDRLGRVLTSNDMQASLRLMSRSFGYTDDPTQGQCRSTQCPEMLEIYSGKHLRLTSGANGILDVVTRNDIALSVNRQNKGDVALPLLRTMPSTVAYLCIDDQGTIYADANGCVKRPAVAQRAR